MPQDIDYILPNGTGIYTVPSSDWAAIKDIKATWAARRQGFCTRWPHGCWPALYTYENFDYFPVGTTFSRSHKNVNNQDIIHVSIPGSYPYPIVISQPLTHAFSIFPLSKEDPRLVLHALQHSDNKRNYFSHKRWDLEVVSSQPKGIPFKKVYVYYDCQKKQLCWMCRKSKDHTFCSSFSTESISPEIVNAIEQGIPLNDLQKKLISDAVFHEGLPIRERDMGSRVKWAFPDPDSSTLPCLYNTEEGNRGEVPDIGLNSYTGTRQWINAKGEVLTKRVTTMPYLGCDLFHYLRSHLRISMEERLDIARQCCELVDEQHKKGILLVDIKPENFAYDEKTKKVAIIDDGGIIKQGEKLRFGTEEFLPPELANNSSVSPTVESDIYTLGHTLNFIFPNNVSAVFIVQCIQQMLSKNVADRKQVSLSAISDLLKLNLSFLAIKHALLARYGITERAKEMVYNFYYNLKNAYSQKMVINDITINALSKALCSPSASTFEWTAMNWLLENFPSEMLQNDHWKKLFDPDIGPSLTCTILGVKEYCSPLKGNFMKHFEGYDDAVQLVKDLLTSKKALTSESIVRITTKAARKSKILAQYRCSQSSHSRSTIFAKYQAIATQFKEPTANTQWDEKKQTLLLNLNHYFPKHHQKWAKIIENELLCDIVIQSMRYIDQTKSKQWNVYNKSHGRKAVHVMIKQLLSSNFEKKMSKEIKKNQNGTLSSTEQDLEKIKETLIKKELKACCDGEKWRYRYRLFKSPSTGDDGSRLKVFESLLKP